MDEPFGALDAHTKLVMQEELATIFKTQLTTTVMVTHDVEEAILPLRCNSYHERPSGTFDRVYRSGLKEATRSLGPHVCLTAIRYFASRLW